MKGEIIKHDDDNVNDNGHDDQPEVKPPIVEPQPQPDDVRRSTKGRYPSMRKVTDGGEPDDILLRNLC